MKRAVLWIVGVGVAGGAIWWARSLGASPGSAMMNAPPPELPSSAPAQSAVGAVSEPSPLDLVRALLEAGDVAAARIAIEAWRARDSGVLSAEWHAAASELERLDRNLEAARAEAERAVELDPHSSAAHFALSRVLRQEMTTGGALGAMLKLGGYKSALERALELNPYSVDARLDQIGFLFFAPGIAGGDIERGIELARALAQTDPRRGRLMLALGLAQDERAEEALQECRSALEEFPDDADLHATLAGLLIEREDYEEADQHLGHAVERGSGPGRCRALYQRAKLRVEGAWELEEAIAMFEQYIEADPRGDLLPPLSGARWRIGNAHEALGRVDEARAAYEASLALDPEFESAQESLDALDD